MPEYNSSLPTLGSGDRVDFQTDVNGRLLTSGAGGGGGAVTIADGADVTLGAQADAAWSGSGSGSGISILKKIVSLLGGTLTTSLSSAIPAGTNVIGHVIVDSAPSNLNAPSNAHANAANGTDVSVVAGVSSKVIYVVGAIVVCGASAATLVFNSKPAGAGTAISATWHLAANGGFVWNATSGGTAFCFTNASEGLTVTTSAAVDVHVVYVQQ